MWSNYLVGFLWLLVLFIIFLKLYNLRRSVNKIVDALDMVATVLEKMAKEDYKRARDQQIRNRIQRAGREQKNGD